MSKILNRTWLGAGLFIQFLVFLAILLDVPLLRPVIVSCSFQHAIFLKIKLSMFRVFIGYELIICFELKLDVCSVLFFSVFPLFSWAKI